MTSMRILYNDITIADNSYHNLENVQCDPTVFIDNPEKNCYYAITLTDPDCSYPSHLHWFAGGIPYNNPCSSESLTFVAFLASDIRKHYYVFTLYKYYDDNKLFKLPSTLISNNNFNPEIFAYINEIDIVSTLTYYVW